MSRGSESGFFRRGRSGGHLWVLYFAYAVMAILGAGTTPITWTRAIAAGFDRQRGIALGLTLTGTGICAMLSPIYAVWLVEHFGWRGAYVGLGLLPLLLAGPLVFIGFRPPRVAEHRIGAPAPVVPHVWALRSPRPFAATSSGCCVCRSSPSIWPFQASRPISFRR
ncbi:MAG: MFS transporter [Gammaproteobacteria bacterium]|nr:MFS transporter [Gammaproteobacteria bacterium]